MICDILICGPADTVYPSKQCLWGQHGATWVMSAPDGPHYGPSNRATVKPVCNDHLYDKIDVLWFIQ